MYLCTYIISFFQYWPSRGTETYGVMCVTLTDTQELATYVIRTFQLQRVSSAHVRHTFPTLACHQGTLLINFKFKIPSFNQREQRVKK